jgi:hypothetical protein
VRRLHRDGHVPKVRIAVGGPLHRHAFSSSNAHELLQVPRKAVRAGSPAGALREELGAAFGTARWHEVALTACVRRCQTAGRTAARQRLQSAYSVEKLCFEGAANGSGPLERSQSCAHGGVPATHHLSPTSRCGARRVARDLSSPTAQQSRRIRRPSEIEFFNRIGR